MQNRTYHLISGTSEGSRVESRILEEKIQQAVLSGNRNIQVEGYGQHGIGGRLWQSQSEPVHIKITGQSGQRAGSMGLPGTTVEIMGPASDDVGWLNAGAEIIVHGNASNGVANAMAQGQVYIGGNLGSRAMTMTKHNPKFEPPELWVLGSVGDYFGEFMAGGIAVVCGIDPQNPENVLGRTPFVGMVGGKAFVRGRHNGFSESDAKTEPLTNSDWRWLSDNLKVFLGKIGRPELLGALSNRDEWQMIRSLSPQEKAQGGRRSMADFRQNVWDRELGRGGLIGDLSSDDMSQIPVLTTGEHRRNTPSWDNKRFDAPCKSACPTGIPVQERWQLIREGKEKEALDLIYQYTPFPASVCGYLCPNLCMLSCTRQEEQMAPMDVPALGRASVQAELPKLPKENGRKVAVVGGGPAGISAAWQLRLRGFSPVIFDLSKNPGGKLSALIPESRIPKKVLKSEISRIKKALTFKHIPKSLTAEEVSALKGEYEYVIVATGAQKPRTLSVPGSQKLMSANLFLEQAKEGSASCGNKVVIIGAGNVGCDVATEASRLGAGEITLIDVQKPSAFGKEKEEALEAGARFKWPCYTQEITDEGVKLSTGEILPADTVIISIGDTPDLGFLPRDISVTGGFVETDGFYRTSDPKIFATGDITGPGLLTDAVGAGKVAAEAVADLMEGRKPERVTTNCIDKARVTLQYMNPSASIFSDLAQAGGQCSSCGSCRDCGICVSICPQSAIQRVETGGSFEYRVNEERCIGCGFCGDACPCGIWSISAA